MVERKRYIIRVGEEWSASRQGETQKGPNQNQKTSFNTSPSTNDDQHAKEMHEKCTKEEKKEASLSCGDVNKKGGKACLLVSKQARVDMRKN